MEPNTLSGPQVPLYEIYKKDREKLPGGPLELFVLVKLKEYQDKGLNSSKIIYKDFCGIEYENFSKNNCLRQVRKALEKLIKKGLVKRKKRYGRNYYYLTKEGKKIILEYFSLD